MTAATRDGPSMFTSTAVSSGASKLTVAAEWTTVRQPASTSRPSSLNPRPSVPTSPSTTCRRRATSASKRSPSSARMRSKQSLRMSSRLTRSAAPVRRPDRTTTATSHSGTERRMRSTRAVPRKPVAPVTPTRPPARASLITASLYHPPAGAVDHADRGGAGAGCRPSAFPTALGRRARRGVTLRRRRPSNPSGAGVGRALAAAEPPAGSLLRGRRPGARRRRRPLGVALGPHGPRVADQQPGGQGEVGEGDGGAAPQEEAADDGDHPGGEAVAGPRRPGEDAGEDEVPRGVDGDGGATGVAAVVADQEGGEEPDSGGHAEHGGGQRRQPLVSLHEPPRRLALGGAAVGASAGVDHDPTLSAVAWLPSSAGSAGVDQDAGVHHPGGIEDGQI